MITPLKFEQLPTWKNLGKTSLLVGSLGNFAPEILPPQGTFTSSHAPIAQLPIKLESQEKNWGDQTRLVGKTSKNGCDWTVRRNQNSSRKPNFNDVFVGVGGFSVQKCEYQNPGWNFERSRFEAAASQNGVWWFCVGPSSGTWYKIITYIMWVVEKYILPQCSYLKFDVYFTACWPHILRTSPLPPKIVLCSTITEPYQNVVWHFK